MWGQTCLFKPPADWRPIQSKDLARTKIGFVKKSSTSFNPSIHLTSERVDCDLKDYVKAVKRVHLSQPNTRWNDLGSIELKAGRGQLTEIRKPSPCGEIVLLQSIFLQDQTAYVLTAAVLKQEFQEYRQEILNSLRSLELTTDIWAALPNDSLKQEFQTLAKKGQWKPFQQLVEQKTANLGAYWQFLALQEGYEKTHAQ